MHNSLVDFIKGFEKNEYSDSIEIVGTNKIIAENIIGILEYGDEVIRISLGRKLLVIHGKNLLLSNYNESNVVIVGDIFNVCFE